MKSENAYPELELEKKYIETKHGKIFYVANQRFPGRPTVVFLHGLSSNHTTFLPSMQKMAENQINTIAPDLRGHGLSDKTRVRGLYRLENMKQDLLAILQAEGPDQVHLVGYSWGGYIAEDFASAYPERVSTLTLVSAGHKYFFAYTPVPFFARIGYIFLTVLGYLVWWQHRAKYHYFNQHEEKTYWQATFSGLATMPLSVNFWLLSQVLRYDFSQALSQVTAPTLLIYTAHDPYLKEKEIQDMQVALRNSKLVKTVCIDSVSHFLASEQEEMLTQTVLDFIQEDN